MAARDDLLACLWLYVNWDYVTRQLTTAERTLFADAVDRWNGGSGANEGPVADRWWVD